MVTAVGRGPLECNDDNRSSLRCTRVCNGYRCRLRVTRAAIKTTVNIRTCNYHSANHFISIRPVLFEIMKTKHSTFW